VFNLLDGDALELVLTEVLHPASLDGLPHVLDRDRISMAMALFIISKSSLEAMSSPREWRGKNKIKAGAGATHLYCTFIEREGEENCPMRTPT
jgi:hypothetical protein